MSKCAVCGTAIDLTSTSGCTFDLQRTDTGDSLTVHTCNPHCQRLLAKYVEDSAVLVDVTVRQQQGFDDPFDSE